MWLDGASGTSTVQTFDWTRFRDIIRTNQPNAVMWGHQGVDARWVGNEDGVTVATNWHTISRTQDQTRYTEAQLQTGVRDGTYWTPAEADARLRSGWFYHDNENPKSVVAVDADVSAVGRPERESAARCTAGSGGQNRRGGHRRADGFQAERETLLSRELVTPNLTVTASSVRGNNAALFGPANAIDGDSDTYWTMNDGQSTGSFEIDLGGIRDVDGFIVQEHIALGQRIGGYAIDAWVNGAYQTVVDWDVARLQADRHAREFRRDGADSLSRDAGQRRAADFEFSGDWRRGVRSHGRPRSQRDDRSRRLATIHRGRRRRSLGLTPLEAFQRGDMNGDGKNDLADFDRFITAYDGVHGAGAWPGRLQVNVPEPSTVASVSASLCA